MDRHIVEARVLNLENNTHYWVTTYPSEIALFFEFAIKNRRQPPQDNMPGVAGGAALALERLFGNIPVKFPLISLIKHLSLNQVANGPMLSMTEIEDALIRWNSFAALQSNDAITSNS